MTNGIIILIVSMIMATLIRLKKCKSSCVLKKFLPYIIMIVGGTLAVYVVLISKVQP